MGDAVIDDINLVLNIVEDFSKDVIETFLKTLLLISNVYTSLNIRIGAQNGG